MKRLVAAVPVVMLVPLLGGWNTAVPSPAGPYDWKSVFITNWYPATGPETCVVGYGATAACVCPGGCQETGFNEHTIISSLALDALGHPELGLGRDPLLAPMIIEDLHTALFHKDAHSRHDATGVTTDPNDTATTPLEERTVPPPAYFTGLADYSYGLYDWMGKNTVCPAVPPNAPYADLCHRFQGWEGWLNSNHFGSQASDTYVQLHALALDLAANAAALKVALDSSTVEGWVYRDILLESQMEALITEGYAQHFLQDRWSSGHMWERWGGPNYADWADAPLAAELGALAGLVHGSQSITSFRDPMCSPSVSNRSVISSQVEHTATPITYRHVGSMSQPDGAVGDHRLLDMFKGSYLPWSTQPMAMDVTPQKGTMMGCVTTGWGQVLTALADPGMAPAPYDAVNLGRTGPCFDNFATNSALYAGFSADGLVSLATLVKGTGIMLTPQGVLLPVDALNAGDWADALLQVTLRGALAPDETDLATGGILPVGTARAGQNYGVAAYTEPSTFAALPVADTTTRMDKETWAGFFHRSHAEYWCAHPDFSALRGSDDPAVQAGCEVLADRFYRGTRQSYRGGQAEERQVGLASALPGVHEADDPVKPLCDVFGSAGGDEEAVPVRIHPGYVRSAQGRTGPRYDSIIHWCAKVPVVDGALQTPSQPCSAPPLGDDWDVVGILDKSRLPDILVLNGRNFGPPGNAGTIELTRNGVPVVVSPSQWTDTRITLRELDLGALTPGDWTLRVVPAAGPASVGRFILRVVSAASPAPYVTDVFTTSGPVKPGDPVGITVTVADPETSADLSQGDEYVDLDSDTFAALARETGGLGAGMCAATFTTTVLTKVPLNDRSNCLPHLWDADLTPTDSALFPLAGGGSAVTGATWTHGLIEVDNVAPVVQQSPAFNEQLLAPGELIRLEATVRDNNHDGTPFCLELPVSSLTVPTQPAGLDTMPALANAVWTRVSDDFSVGEAVFAAEVRVAARHMDNQDGCASGSPPNLQIPWQVTDDKGTPPDVTPPPFQVRIRNVAPVLSGASSTPAALHPGVTTTITLEAVVSDDNDTGNQPPEIEAVSVDALGCGGTTATLGPSGTPGLWRGTTNVMATAACAVVLRARDDDCEFSMPVALNLPVQNVPPRFTGHILGWDSNLSECNAVTISAGFSDDNGDQLSVEALLQGPGGPVTVPLMRVDERYVGTFNAPCAGTYTVTVTATETNPPGGFPNTVVSPTETITVGTAAAGACPACHSPRFCAMGEQAPGLVVFGDFNPCRKVTGGALQCEFGAAGAHCEASMPTPDTSSTCISGARQVALPTATRTDGPATIAVDTGPNQGTISLLGTPPAYACSGVTLARGLNATDACAFSSGTTNVSVTAPGRPVSWIRPGPAAGLNTAFDFAEPPDPSATYVRTTLSFMPPLSSAPTTTITQSRPFSSLLQEGARRTTTLAAPEVQQDMAVAGLELTGGTVCVTRETDDTTLLPGGAPTTFACGRCVGFDGPTIKACEEEQCDGVDNDCDGAIDNGCPSGLDVYSGIGDQSPVFGNPSPTNSSLFSVSCAYHSFLAGLTIRDVGPVRQFGGTCSGLRLGVDTSVVPYRYTIEYAVTPAPLPTTGLTGSGGGGTGALTQFLCPPHTFITGIRGTAATEVGSLQFECSGLALERAPGNVWRIVRSPASGGTSSPVAGSGPGTPYDFSMGQDSLGNWTMVRSLEGRHYNGGNVAHLYVTGAGPRLRIR